MSNLSAPNESPELTQAPRLRQLLQRRPQLRLALFIFAGLLAILPIWMLVSYQASALSRPVFIWSVVCFLITLVMALFDLSNTEEDEATEIAKFRLELMMLGGLLGLATALLGLILPFTVYREQLGSSLDSWRKNWDAVLYPSLATFGGLALMFVSLQLSRGLERRSQAMRQLLYGFNTVLTSILLIAVLALPNILAYAEPFTRFFGRPFDWTQSGVNSIDSRMRNLLANLNEPVKVYALLPRNHPITQDTETLLENCRSLNPRLFSWEAINPQSIEQQTRITGLMEKYSISDPNGLLVLVGTEGEKTRPDSTFIKFRDLFEQDFSGRGRQSLSYSYNGEGQLYSAIQSLSDSKVVIYFTTGHGELTPDETAPRLPGMARQAGSLSRLRSKLTERKGVEVKTLTLDRSTKKVPDDASVVVIARPTQEFGANEVQVLRNYLQRSRVANKTKDASGREKEEETVTTGRLLILVEPVIEKQGGSNVMARTGLDDLLAEYDVRLGDRLITASRPNPLEIVCWTASGSSNPIARAFHPSPTTRIPFLFNNVRAILPVEKGTRSVDRIMEAPPRYAVWTEANLNRDPSALVSALRQDEDLAIKTLSDKPITVGVAVSDSSSPPGMPRDAAHAGQLKDTPRMVVFGTASWITDDSLASGRASSQIDLFENCLLWLREKSGIGLSNQITGKKRQEYEPNIPPQEAGRLTYLPLGLMLLAVIGLGTGVWVVRRR
jgi:hypothetical protein